MTPETENEDPVALARKFATGHNLPRGRTIQLVRDLLARIDQPAPAAPPEPAIMLTPDPAAHAGPCARGLRLPLADAVIKSPIKVHTPGGPGSIFLGAEANRHYTRLEALGLAQEIVRQVGEGGANPPSA